jgi:hypothetical protein
MFAHYIDPKAPLGLGTLLGLLNFTWREAMAIASWYDSEELNCEAV